jgi:arylsulfatase
MKSTRLRALKCGDAHVATSAGEDRPRRRALQRRHERACPEAAHRVEQRDAKELRATARTAEKPNIIPVDVRRCRLRGLGCYVGDENRRASTPHLARFAADGLQFMSFQGQPNCTPGRAAAMTDRLPIPSGKTTVTLPNQRGGLMAAESTLARVLKKAGYSTIQIGKWHLGEENYATPTEHGFDETRNTTL